MKGWFYMKYIFGLLLMLVGTQAHAGTSCVNLAISAAKGIYSLNAEGQPVSKVDVRVNPKNSSNAVSLIVMVNGHSYLVALTPVSNAGDSTAGCASVDYVIAYPYANLMPQ